MHLDGVHHIGINVRDLDRALAFYCGVLEMEVTERYEESIRHVMLGAGSVGLHLFETPDLDLAQAQTTLSEQGYAHIALGTTRDQFSEALARLKEKGVDFKGPMILGKGESVHFKDPDDNHLEIRCPAP